ncbi:uncharacterized protein [Argopecten irradians]|uniref:uncharacterized protein n=1 Tax=Argopecten irradians TaxID=31199 RepID=UPI003714754C
MLVLSEDSSQFLQSIGMESASQVCLQEVAEDAADTDLGCLIPLFTNDIDNVWNTAISDIFLSLTPTSKPEPKESSNRKTSHRLLTCEAVLDEKREKQRKKEEKELKAEL